MNSIISKNILDDSIPCFSNGEPYLWKSHVYTNVFGKKYVHLFLEINILRYFYEDGPTMNPILINNYKNVKFSKLILILTN